MYNWFVGGHEIEADHWYFREEEGGRVLGNLCHWTDFVYHLVPEEQRYPLVIRPTRAERSDCDIAVTYTFGDGTVAAITFSAKGHTFEGVRERFSGHRGNLLISMDDFKTLEMHVGDRVTRQRNRFRDHGHSAQILKSYGMTSGSSAGATARYVWETGEMFLATKDALETSETRTVHGYAGRHAATSA
jgi:predicted dehydrogenase